MEANTALGDDGGGVWNMTQWFKSMILFLNNIKIWYTIYNLTDEKEYSHLYSLATQSVFWTNNYDIIFLHILQLSRFELHCMGPLTGRVFFFSFPTKHVLQYYMVHGCLNLQLLRNICRKPTINNTWFLTA